MPRPSNPSPVPPRDPRAWVELWSRSGLSARAFAAQHGLVMSTLYGWRRQLRRAGAITDVDRAPRLLPVVTVAPLATLCEVQLRNGRVLRFPPSLAPAALGAFVRVLEAGR